MSSRRVRRGTPGPLGYVITWTVSVIVVAVVMALLIAAEELDSIPVLLMVALIYTAVLSLPGILLLLPLAHLALRRVEPQAVHVLVVGVAGFLTGLGYLALITQGSWSAELTAEALLFPMLTGAAAAIGRAVVIPLVPLSPGPTPADAPEPRSARNPHAP